MVREGWQCRNLRSHRWHNVAVTLMGICTTHALGTLRSKNPEIRRESLPSLNQTGEGFLLEFRNGHCLPRAASTWPHHRRALCPRALPPKGRRTAERWRVKAARRFLSRSPVCNNHRRARCPHALPPEGRRTAARWRVKAARRFLGRSPVCSNPLRARRPHALPPKGRHTVARWRVTAARRFLCVCNSNSRRSRAARAPA